MNQTKTARWGIHVVAIVELEVKPECDDEQAIAIVETYIRLADVSDAETRQQTGFKVIDIDHWRIGTDAPDQIPFETSASCADIPPTISHGEVWENLPITLTYGRCKGAHEFTLATAAEYFAAFPPPQATPCCCDEGWFIEHETVQYLADHLEVFAPSRVIKSTETRCAWT